MLRLQHSFTGTRIVVLAALCVPELAQAEQERHLLTTAQMFEQDLLQSRYPSKSVYENGARHTKLTESSGTDLYPIVSCHLNLDMTGWMKVGNRQAVQDQTGFTYRENVGALTGTLIIGMECWSDFNSPRARANSFGFLDRALDGAWNRQVPLDAVKKLKARYKTDLEAADFLFGLKRSDVVNPTKPPDPEMMALVLAGPLSFVTSLSDNLTRYEVDGLVMYVSVVDEKDESRVQAWVFGRDGHALVQFLMRARTVVNKPVARKDVESILARVKAM